MKVIVKYLNGNLVTFDDADDVDEGFETVDIYLQSGRTVELEKSKVKKVSAVYSTPAGEDIQQIYFNKKPLEKKEVSTMSKEVKATEAEEVKAMTAEAEAAEAEEAEAAEASEDDDDFDFAESFNRKGKLFSIDTTDFEGHKAAEVYKDAGSEPLIMKAVFINKDNGFGESVSVVTPNGIIYFSKTNLEAAHNIRDNEKAVSRLNKTGALFRITEYESKKFKKKGYGFEFLKKDEIPEYLKNYMKTGEIGSDAPEDAALFRW